MTTTTASGRTNRATVMRWRHACQPDRNPAITATTRAASTGSTETNPPRAGVEGVAR